VSSLLEETQAFEEEEGEAQDATPPIDKENVFYAGTRTSDN
jgi:hypothetical protein